MPGTVPRKGQQSKGQSRTAVGFLSALFTASAPAPSTLPDTQLALSEMNEQMSDLPPSFNLRHLRLISQESGCRVKDGAALEEDGFLPCELGPILHHYGPQFPQLSSGTDNLIHSLNPRGSVTANENLKTSMCIRCFLTGTGWITQPRQGPLKDPYRGPPRCQ